MGIGHLMLLNGNWIREGIIQVLPMLFYLYFYSNVFSRYDTRIEIVKLIILAIKYIA